MTAEEIFGHKKDALLCKICFLLATCSYTTSRSLWLRRCRFHKQSVGYSLDSYLQRQVIYTFVKSPFPEIRIILHFSLIIVIPFLHHAQRNKAFRGIGSHLRLRYGKGRRKIEEIIQHFLCVFDKRVKRRWCCVCNGCLLSKLVQGLNWNSYLSPGGNGFHGIHGEWVLHPFLWLYL